jgi:hypothetical protein
MFSIFVTTVVTVEMRAAAMGALELVGQPRDRDGGREAARIDVLRRGGEQVVDALGAGQLGVARLVARVCGEVIGIVELRRVDEQPDDDDVDLRPRTAHERKVAVVERPHRRDEADRVSVATFGC